MKLLALTFAILLASALGSNAAAQSVADDSGGIMGTVTDVGGSEVLIEENPEERFDSDKSYVRITPDTRIWKRVDGNRVAARFEDLAVGCRVEARFSGPVAESYPTQAAASVVVLDGESGNLPGTGGPSPTLFWVGVALVFLVAVGVACGRLLRRP